MRDAGNSWSEIAKVGSLQLCKQRGLIVVGQTFPNRTEGSVKKHWYKVSGKLTWPWGGLE